MSNLEFVHLHLHTEYSPLDGLSKIVEIVQRVKELGMTSVAITDHGSMSGLFEAQKIGEKYGVKIIQGCEFYHMFEDKNAHIIVLAKNDIGLKNLNLLHESSYIDGFYKKPNITIEKLIEHKEGLIVSTACLGSQLNKLILGGRNNEVKQYILMMKKHFGEDFYLEIQANQIAEQSYVNSEIIKLSKLYDVEVILTNDVHYTFKEDWYSHEVLLGLQFNKKFSDEKRYKFTTQDFWLKSSKEMLETTNGISEEDILNAMANTVKVADKCNSSYKKGKYLPEYKDKSDTPRKLLSSIINDGAKVKGKASDKNYMKAVQHELNIIDEEGYCGYYLIVQDYASHARNNGIIVGEGRGSGAGSKCAYLSDITRIEPEQYGLLFERFMAHGRTPDLYKVA